MSSLHFPVNLPIGQVLPNGTVRLSPEFHRFMQSLLSVVGTADTIPLYFGTGFPANAASPSLLIQTDGSGAFSDFVVRN